MVAVPEGWKEQGQGLELGVEVDRGNPVRVVVPTHDQFSCVKIGLAVQGTGAPAIQGGARSVSWGQPGQDHCHLHAWDKETALKLKLWVEGVRNPTQSRGHGGFQS